MIVCDREGTLVTAVIEGVIAGVAQAVGVFTDKPLTRYSADIKEHIDKSVGALPTNFILRTVEQAEFIGIKEFVARGSHAVNDLA